jgi:hypothetical protein
MVALAPDEALAGPERHFGVADTLAKLPVGWLYVGRLKDVGNAASIE